MELKFTLYQRFESLKSYINTELRGILAVYPEQTERVATEIESLASSSRTTSIVVAPVLSLNQWWSRVASDGQDMNAYVEPAIPTANNLPDNC